jgi:hypothetical protein
MGKKIAKLKVNRETLRELTAPDLRRAAGGALPTQQQGCLGSVTPSQCCTGYYPSLNAPCTE